MVESPSVRSLFIVKFCDFTGTRHIIHQELVSVPSWSCWQDLHGLASALGTWPDHAHQALAPRVMGIRVQCHGNLCCSICEASFLPSSPPPHISFDQRIALWTVDTSPIWGVSGRISSCFLLGSFPAPLHAFPEMQMEVADYCLKSLSRGTSLTRCPAGTEAAGPDLIPAWQLLSPLTCTWPLAAVIKWTSTSGGLDDTVTVPENSPLRANFGAPKSLQMVTAAMKLKDAYSLKGKLWPT